MGAKAFRYEFTLNELRYFLFAKKNCPKCGSKMRKSKGYEIVDGKIFNTQSLCIRKKRSKILSLFI